MSQKKKFNKFLKYLNKNKYVAFNMARNEANVFIIDWCLDNFNFFCRTNDSLFYSIINNKHAHPNRIINNFLKHKKTFKKVTIRFYVSEIIEQDLTSADPDLVEELLSYRDYEYYFLSKLKLPEPLLTKYKNLAVVEDILE